MYKILSTVLFLLIVHCSGWAQVLPAEGRSLNYRLVGFSFPPASIAAKGFEVQIAAGTYNKEDSFGKNIINTISGKEPKMIGEVPSFGKEYTWRSVEIDAATVKTYSALHHFKTSFSNDIDTSITRVRIIDTAQAYRDAYVFLDGCNTLYDMKGRPVWYLPTDGLGGTACTRDLKATSFGTITFINNDEAYEVNYDGELVWKAPNNGKVSGEAKEHYHHGLDRLSNGHYMVMGNETVYGKRGGKGDNSFFVSFKYKNELGATDSNYMPVRFGTIIEYDEQGNVAWSWKSSDYFKETDLHNYKPGDGIDGIGMMDMHENAFSFDEKNKIVYVSFKNISRIVKVKYPEGTILNEYGEKYKTGVPQKGNDLFCNQHACKVSAIGCLFLFNNNGCNPGALPKLKKLTEPAVGSSGQLKKVWEYVCTTEKNVNTSFPMGGNIIELPDESVFACMGSMYSKVFIVTPQKKLLWSALPEKWNAEEKRWKPVSQYRASIIYDREQLERMIWNSEIKQKRS
ncbi:MAG: hypothetical protein JWQ38_1818 [Flavipsychrobacter sp.]|nr:hypothetical protein [Flavipsychrobacter sp.]